MLSRACLLICLSLLSYAQAPKKKGFSVEEKPTEALEKATGIRERYALLIGISKYANASLSLGFAAADAQSLQKVLLDPEIGGYKPENVRLLVDEQATRKNIMSGLNSWLRNRVGADDSVIIFYSGHGALGPGNEAYWVTHDADVEDLGSSALSNKDISSSITALAARRKLTLIDSCYSEATAKKFRAVVPGNVFDEFKGEGVVTMTASSGQQKSVEVGGHGAFTYHLLEGLQGKADSNQNGMVELDEIWGYLNEKVQKTAADAGNRQTPVLMAERLEHGFPVTLNPSNTATAVIAQLRGMYAQGEISLDEMGEAERVLNRREGGPELRNLYKGLADKALAVNYFRQLRLVLAAPAASAAGGARAAEPAPAAAAAAGVPAAAPGAPAAPGASGAELESFRVAETVNTTDGWIRYLQQFPQGYLGGAARTRLEELDQKKGEAAAWQLARQSDVEKTWDQFLTMYPTGPHVAEGQRRVSELRQKRESEMVAFRTAESKNAESAWSRFLKEYPDSQLAMLAEERLETMRRLAKEKEDNAYAKAVRSSSLEDWQSYIAEYPNGRFIDEANRKRAEVLKKLEEERERKAERDLYASARAADSAESWSAYIAKYPSGPNSAEGRTRIEQLKWLAFADAAPVPAGAFDMGDDKEKEEKPRHRVELDGFLLGRNEVTNAQYLAFATETNYRRPADPPSWKNYFMSHPELPVVNVGHADAQAFCKWLSQKTGGTVRLPTEAEWEYAAHGGQGALYPWGNDQPKTKARYKGNAPSGVGTVAKAAFAPNGYGLHNMSGNVAEWMADYYMPRYFPEPGKKNPTGPASGAERVVRGGSWRSGDSDLRCTRRGHAAAPSDQIGFRIVVQPAARAR
jgi:sulfatase modifying factor 1